MAGRRAPADVWETIFGIAYLVVGTNVMGIVACAPLILLLVSTDPQTSWPALALSAVAATPAVTAAFAVFDAFSVHRSTEVIRTFWRAWWQHLRRSLGLGALLVGAVVVIAVDLVVLVGTRFGAVMLPVLVVAGLLLAATVLLSLVAGVERPEARLRDVLKASLYLGVRRWYLTAVSFAVLGLSGVLFIEYPAIALGLAAAPLLYAVWGNSRYTLRPVLPEGAAVQV